MGCSAVGAVVSSGINAFSANAAAKTQADAAKYAANLQLQEQQQVRSDLAPYRDVGHAANDTLAWYTMGNDPSAVMKQLENTPGYQFSLAQGLKSVQNSAAARGLGTSGAALKGAAGFATGLAQNTVQQNLLNPLQFLGSTGENAAAQTGNLGTQGAANAGAGIIGAGNAGAAGIAGVGNALSNGANALGNAPLNYQLYNKLLNGGGGSGSGGGGGGYEDTTTTLA